MWMTDKCRRRMNRREGYITIEISQRMGGRLGRGGRPSERKEAPVWSRGVDAFPSSSERSLFPGTLGRPILCAFHLQNKPSPHQSPTFGPTLYKFIVMGSVWKPWPYNFLFFIFYFRDKGFHVYKYANLSLFLTFILQPIIFITSIIYAFWKDLIIIMVHLKFA